MAELWQQIVLGIAQGAIFASLALALVLIYRASGVVNFAQGEMAMFTTYIALALTRQGLSYWEAFFATLAIGFFGGLLLERTVIRPVEHAPTLAIVMVTIGLVVVFNGLAAWIWGPQVQFMPSAFPGGTVDVGGGATVGIDQLGTIGVCLGLVAIVFCFFRFTKLGLAMRASALAPETSRLLGVRVSWMLAIGWGLAAVLGAVSGMLVAPVNFLTPNLMQSILLYAFAAAVVGGIESPIGAVVGGLLLGVVLNLLQRYVGFMTPELLLPIALLVIMLVLTVRPSGLFGKPVVRRV
jgi:branched-chain amino acid transport system permease protein